MKDPSQKGTPAYNILVRMKRAQPVFYLLLDWERGGRLRRKRRSLARHTLERAARDLALLYVEEEIAPGSGTESTKEAAWKLFEQNLDGLHRLAAEALEKKPHAAGADALRAFLEPSLHALPGDLLSEEIPPGTAYWPDRLHACINETTGGNVSAFQERCQRVADARYGGVQLFVTSLHTYLERGAVPSGDRLCAIAEAAGRSPFWLIAGIEPARLFSDAMPAEPDIVEAPFVTIGAGALKRTRRRFAVDASFLPADVSFDRLGALTLTESAAFVTGGFPQGADVLIELSTSEEGRPLGEAARDDPSGRDMAYVVSRRAGQSPRVARISTTGGRAYVEDRDGLISEPADLQLVRVHARIIKVWVPN